MSDDNKPAQYARTDSDQAIQCGYDRPPCEECGGYGGHHRECSMWAAPPVVGTTAHRVDTCHDQDCHCKRPPADPVCLPADVAELLREWLARGGRSSDVSWELDALLAALRTTTLPTVAEVQAKERERIAAAFGAMADEVHESVRTMVAAGAEPMAEMMAKDENALRVSAEQVRALGDNDGDDQ